jgi:hypothetical protein
MKTIQLTRGYSVLVDDEDYESLSGLKWCSWVGESGHVYAVHSMSKKDGYRKIAMHRLIMEAPPGMQVDHIQLFAYDNVIDNRKSNLRLATRHQNLRSRSKRCLSRSIFKGVSYNTQDRNPSRPWRARVKHDGKFVHAGCFTVEAHAAIAYDLKAVELYGRFALTNFPVPGSVNWLFGERP